MKYHPIISKMTKEDRKEIESILNQLNFSKKKPTIDEFVSTIANILDEVGYDK